MSSSDSISFSFQRSETPFWWYEFPSNRKIHRIGALPTLYFCCQINS